MTERVDRYAANWLDKARFARICNENGEKWPPWSTGEILAVALILDDAGMFIALDITKQEALDRLRYDLELPDIVGAARWFADLRAQL